MIAVTRRYRFPAAHVLRSDAFSEADTERIYGKCANALAVFVEHGSNRHTPILAFPNTTASGTHI